MPTLRIRDTKQPPRRYVPNKAFYQSARWHKYSLQYRKQHRLCILCKANGITRLSEEVDHIIPIVEGGDLWNPDNHQALCKSCHSQKTKREMANRKKEDYEV